MAKGVPLSKEVIEQAQRLYDAGLSTIKVAELLGHSHFGISKNITTRNRSAAAKAWHRLERRDKVMRAGRMHMDGYRTSFIARALGCHRKTAWKYVADYYSQMGITGWQRRGQQFDKVTP